MMSNYIIYLSTLSTIERNKYLLYISLFFTVILLFCGILYLIRNKFLDKNKNTLFQKFSTKRKSKFPSLALFLFYAKFYKDVVFKFLPMF